jgi:hypothetical protein
VVAFATVVFGSSAGGQEAVLSPGARDADTWMRAVAIHVSGQRDEPVAHLARWARADLDDLLPVVSKLDEAVRARLVQRALVLHTDVALLNRTITGYALPPDGRPTELFVDGKETGTMFGTFHWEFGRRLIERLPRGEERTAVGRAFYRAAGAVLQLWGEHAELRPHLAAASRAIGEASCPTRCRARSGR